MRTSEQIAELAGALSKAQGAFTSAEREHIAKVQSKKGDASSYSYAYADLASYLDVCRKPLADNGLAFIQSPKVCGELVSVTTLLIHASGQFWESDPLEMRSSDSAPQAIGSTLTYCRRYSLSACIGMASEADDDANSGSGNQASTGQRERAPKPPCPACGKTEFVYEDRQKGGFFCWKQKGGCGKNWLPDEAGDAAPPQAPAAPAARTAAQKVAEEHGMTTGDQVPPPKLSPAVKSAFDKISHAVRKGGNAGTEEVAAIVNTATERRDSGVLSEDALGQIMREASLALQKIKAQEKEPEHAA